jgi:hypothetical protein
MFVGFEVLTAKTFKITVFRDEIRVIASVLEEHASSTLKMEAAGSSRTVWCLSPEDCNLQNYISLWSLF